MKRFFVLLVGLFVAWLVASNQAQAQLFNGNLLPGQSGGATNGDATHLPKTIQQIQATAVDTDLVQRYVGNAGANGGPLTIMNEPPVTCAGNVIGTMRFQFGAYTGNFGGGGDNTAGGMLIRGGFTLNQNFALAPNHSLRWVQYFDETLGANHTTMIDGNPLYPNHTLAGVTSLFFDAPADVLTRAATPDRIDFEAALVCFDNASPMALHSIGSFRWGYHVDKVTPTIDSEYALIFTPPLTQAFQNEFTAEFGPAGTRGRGFTLDADCASCFLAVPEPGTLVMVATGMGGLLCRQLPRRPASHRAA